MPEKPGDPLAYRLFNEIGIIDQLAGAAFREVLPPPLNQAMFGVINHFVRLGDGKTPTELARAFQVTKPSMTHTLAKLEKAGMVVIAQDPDDGRTKRITITAKGREARNEAVAATQVLFGSIRGELQNLDLERIVEDLASLRAILDAARD